MSEQLVEELRRAAQAWRAVGGEGAEGIADGFDRAADTIESLQQRNALLLLDSAMLAAALEERDELLERVSELEEGLNIIAEWHIEETRNDYQAIARRLLKDTR